ncbi:MAG: RIP metalloprotease RseP [Candidatus Protistobacter heckmanni]|nr:RIP metalloprotease RseP [Candidatus Protistobacter heckmanni]
MALLQTVLAFVVALGVLVTVHEFGHYLAARACGVRVLRFSVGFGRPLLRWQRSPEDTEWVVAALPLGGYVRMLDENEEDARVPPELAHEAFNRKPLGQRAIVVLAGPAANLLLAVALYAGLWMAGQSEPVARLAAPPADSAAAAAGLHGGETVTGLRLGAGGELLAVRSWTELAWNVVRLHGEDTGGSPVLVAARGADGREGEYPLVLPQAESADSLLEAAGLRLAPGEVVVREVLPGSAAQHAGVRKDDRILQLDGKPVTRVTDFLAGVQDRAGHQVRIVLRRAGRVMAIESDVAASTDAKTGKPAGRVGLALAEAPVMTRVSYPPLEALTRGVRQVWDLSMFSVRMFGKMLIGQASLSNLSGPLTIADYAGKTARLGIEPFISFLALISVSLGVLNLLPIPVLDGGHLLYHCGEFLLGKPLPERWTSVLQRVGMSCLLFLALLALFNDVSRLLG